MPKGRNNNNATLGSNKKGLSMAKISLNMDSLKPKKEWKRHKVQDGSNTFRFLPPFGPESNGYHYRKWGVIWGLVDPVSGRKRPFASTSTFEGKCPVYEYLDVLKVQIKTLEAQLIQSGMSEADIKARLKDTNTFIGNLRPKTVFAYNACDKSGTVGILELKKTAHDELCKLINQYIRDYNQDPTSLNSAMDDSGVWFNITREGTMFETKYGVVKNQTRVKDPNTGALSYQDDRTALPEHVVTDYENLAYDLNSVYQKKTYDELKEILIANLSYLVEDNPDLKVEGFYVDTSTIQQPAVQPVNAPVTPQATSKQGAGKININMGALKTEDDTTIAAPAAPQQPTATQSVTMTTQATQPTSTEDTDDLLKMADDIFNQ